jgi:iron-sulfur cluster repair protein YtfE (RIC family)
MVSSRSLTHSATLPIQPLDRLKWEHVRLIDGVGRLQLLAGGDEADYDGIRTEATAVLKALEYHQEAEERFLFPLVWEHGETLLAGLRKEHLRFVMGSDNLLSLTRPGNETSLSDFLVTLRTNLKTHFAKEESGVFLEAAGSLSPAQMDILRIKFASRKGMDL